MAATENRFSGKSFSVDRKITVLTTEIHFRSYFHFKWFSELGTRKESSQTRKGRMRERKNDLAKHRSRRLSRSTTPITIDASRDRNRRERYFARSCRVLLGFVHVLLGFVFSFSRFCLFLLFFQTSENIFWKIFWNATKHMKTFSFLENEIFSGNAFTRTKHSLRQFREKNAKKNN